MRSIQNSLLMLLLLTFLAACGKNEQKTSENKSDEQKKETTTSTQTQSNKVNPTDLANSETAIIELPTIQCDMCRKNIEKAFDGVEGVNDVVVDVKEKVARVNYVKTKSDINKLESVIVMTGYQANDKPANEEAYNKLEKCCQIDGHK